MTSGGEGGSTNANGGEKLDSISAVVNELPPSYAESVQSEVPVYPILSTNSQPQNPQQVQTQPSAYTQVVQQQIPAQQQPTIVYIQQQPQQVQMVQYPQQQMQYQQPMVVMAVDPSAAPMNGYNYGVQTQGAAPTAVQQIVNPPGVTNPNQNTIMTAKEAAAREDEWRGGCCSTRNVWLFFVVIIAVSRVGNLFTAPYYVAWWTVLLTIVDCIFLGVACMAGCRYSLKWAKPYYVWIVLEFIITLGLFIWIITSFEEWCESNNCDEDIDDIYDTSHYYNDCTCADQKSEIVWYYIFDFILIALAFMYFKKFRNRLIATGQR